jgi:hypothetical protein
MGLPPTIENDLAGGGLRVSVVAALCVAGLAALAWQRRRIGGTTLVAPWVWSLVALATVAGSEALIRLGGGEPALPWAVALRFAAAMSTFCPTMALLGAKRPQNRAWQLIVLALWGILSLPSLEWLLYGGAAEIHPARFWFLVVLIATGALNGIGTRYWVSSLLYGGGQVLLLWPFFVPQGALAGADAPPLGISALVLAWLLLAAQWPRGKLPTLPLDRVWLDFRDAFGVVWGLRVAERINASARRYGWPIQLGWSGFRQPDSTLSPEVPEAAEDSLRTLLRRFVSPDWIDARLGDAESRAALGPTAPCGRPTT